MFGRIHGVTIYDVGNLKKTNKNKCPFKNMDYLSSKMELAEPRVNSQYVLHTHKNIILDESVRL